MPALPWTAATNTRPAENAEVLVMASRFHLKSLTQVPAFLLAAMRIRAQMLASPGAVGVALIAKPLARTFYTLSAWTDRAAIDAAIAIEPHRRTMTRFHPLMESSAFAFWNVDPAALPVDWADAICRLDEE